MNIYTSDNSFELNELENELEINSKNQIKNLNKNWINLNEKKMYLNQNLIYESTNLNNQLNGQLNGNLNNNNYNDNLSNSNHLNTQLNGNVNINHHLNNTQLNQIVQETTKQNNLHNQMIIGNAYSNYPFNVHDTIINGKFN